MLSLKNQSFKYGYFAREDVVLYKTLEKKIWVEKVNLFVRLVKMYQKQVFLEEKDINVQHTTLYVKIVLILEF